jgi:NAD-dependent deacetylase
MLKKAVDIIKNAERVCAFTGAGISVESGIPPFRGPDGLWSKYDPSCLDIERFLISPEPSWRIIKELFYDFFGKARPNAAHTGLAELEALGLLHSVITQNIDNLHQLGGSKIVHEFHGTASRMICLDCHKSFASDEIKLDKLPPGCPHCAIGHLKPDFIFFGEAIPEPARTNSFEEAELSDVFLVIGTTGEIMPASMIPHIACENGAKIIEINTRPSNYTNQIVDVFLQGPATTTLKKLVEAVKA